jgi:hypothetical protein
MKNNLVIILVMSVLSVSSLAQDCTPAGLLQKSGTWKEGMKGSTAGLLASDLSRQRAVVAALHTMIKSKYTPVGVVADFGGSYGSPQPSMPANSYGYSIFPLNYFCEGSTIQTAHETSTHFSIDINSFDAEIYESAQGDRARAEGFNAMPDMPSKKDGYYIFNETDVSLGFGMGGKRKMWLVTYDGKLPWSYVSKKEFLEKRKEILTAQMLEASSGFRDILKNKEIEKGFKEKEYKNDAVKLERYMRMDYQSTKDRYEKLLADNEKTFRPAFSKVESRLKMSSSELGEPAIVKKDPNDPLSYLFTDDGDPNGQVLIKPNPAYFNKKLSRSSPQFISVTLVGNGKDPIAARAMTDIMTAVDFSLLKNMLAK